jgi:hypothetical protein
MRPGALPISQIILLDLIAPPIAALLWQIMSRGWAGVIQLGNVSQETKRRQNLGFWIVLVLGYVVMFGITIYACLT